MVDPMKILTAQIDGDDGIILTFSDGTTAGFVVEELLGLRPRREPTDPPSLEERS
jgi:hypothetical protein